VQARGSLAACVLAGCTLSTDFDRFDRETGRDAGAIQDAASEAAPPGTSDAGDGANLHRNGGFERDCSGWFPYRSTLAPSPLARTGAGACLVCADETDPYFATDDHGVLARPPVGAEYRVEAWVRRAPGSPALLRSNLTLRTRNEWPFTVVEQGVDDGPGATDGWQRLEARLAVTRPAESLNVAVSAQRGQGRGCFVVDDVVLVRTR
jgi:hypothetical protein